MSAINLVWMYSVNLLPVTVKEDSVSRQSSTDLFRYCWIHLLPVIIKVDCVSVNLVWMYSEMAGFTYKLQWSRRTVSAANLARMYSDVVGFTYTLQQ
jgi:hypothetical protein